MRGRRRPGYRVVGRPQLWQRLRSKGALWGVLPLAPFGSRHLLHSLSFVSRGSRRFGLLLTCFSVPPLQRQFLRRVVQVLARPPSRLLTPALSIRYISLRGQQARHQRPPIELQDGLLPAKVGAQAAQHPRRCRHLRLHAR